MRLFVCGTDTGVGKTHLACAIAHLVQRKGRTVVAYKPIETGYETFTDPSLSDGARLAAVTKQAPQDVVPLTFAHPSAPAEAARRANQSVELDSLIHKCPTGDFVIVEGAGGLLVPFTEHALGIDLVGALADQVVLIAAGGLGTINHTLLSIRALQSIHHNPHVILNDITNDPLANSNGHWISHFGQPASLQIVHGNQTPEALSEQIELSML